MPLYLSSHVPGVFYVRYPESCVGVYFKVESNFTARMHVYVLPRLCAGHAFI
jgi:hypothetical protein